MGLGEGFASAFDLSSFGALMERIGASSEIP